MNDLLPSVLTVFVGAIFAYLKRSGFDGLERRFLWASFIAHIVASVGQLRITQGYYIGGDIFYYFTVGHYLSSLIEADFRTYFVEIAKLTLQMESVFSFVEVDTGTSTATMSGLAGILLYFLRGSEYAVSIFVGILSYFGTVAMYEALREELPDLDRRRILIACLLVPSVVYWSSSMLKEAFALAAIGFMCRGGARFARGRFTSAAIHLVLGGYALALTKPYILFAFVLAGAAWLVIRRANAKGSGFFIRPAYFLLALVVGAGGLNVLGTFFPQFALDRFADEAARYQALGATVSGGSNYFIGNEEADGLGGQIYFAPIALFTALFRPLVFEVRNATMAANAIETTWLLGMFLLALRRRSVRELWRTMISSPGLVFCVAFTIVLGTAVGLATTNLGTLSRYRMPLLPFLSMTLLAFSAKTMVSRKAREAPGVEGAPVELLPPPRAPVTGLAVRQSARPTP